MWRKLTRIKTNKNLQAGKDKWLFPSVPLSSYPWPKAYNLESALNGEQGGEALVKFSEKLFKRLRLAMILQGPYIHRVSEFGIPDLEIWYKQQTWPKKKKNYKC